MYVVTCPHCRRRLRMSREVHQAKMKCRYCGNVFEGSTEPMAAPSPAPPRPDQAPPGRKADGGTAPRARKPTSSSSSGSKPPAPAEALAPPPPVAAGGKAPDPAAAAAAAIASEPAAPKPDSARPARPHGPVKKSWSTGAIVAAGAGLAVTVGLVIGLIVYIQQRHDDPPGAIVLTKGNEFGQADAQLRDQQAEQQRKAAAARQASGEAPFGPGGLRVAADPSSPQGPAVRINSFEQLPDDPTQMPTWVGTYVNDNRSTLARAWIEVIIENAQGQTRVLKSPALEYIPPGWDGRFSVMADFRLSEDMRILRQIGRAERAKPDVVAIDLGPQPYERVSEDELKITALAKNTTTQTLRDPIVVCDFFSSGGLYLGTARGQWRQKTDALRPGQSESFELFFTPDEAGFSVMLVASPKPRLVGRTEN